MKNVMLHKDVAAAVKQYLREAVRGLIVSQKLWNEIEQVLQEEFDDNTNCFLDFDDSIESGAEVSVSIGEAVQRLPLILSYDHAWQLRGMDKFIAQLQECRTRLARGESASPPKER